MSFVKKKKYRVFYTEAVCHDDSRVVIEAISDDEIKEICRERYPEEGGYSVYRFYGLTGLK